MIERSHQKGDAASVAVYSPCESYRYLLTRTWAPESARALFVMLNPSTATEMQNDPTVERCERRARTLGFGAFRVTNIFGWRATDPKVLRQVPDPVGPGNDAAIARSATEWVRQGTADRIICAWGTHGTYLDRGEQVALLLSESGQPLHHLGLTREGHPRHPLYVGYAVQPAIWTDPRGSQLR